MPARCEVCDEALDEHRAMIIAMSNNTLPCRCLKHSSVQKQVGVNNHANAGELVIIPSDKEGKRRAYRQYNRAR